MSKKQNQKNLAEDILQTVKEEKPETVEQLVHSFMNKKKSVSRAKIMDQILQLQSEGRIVFKEPENAPVRQFSLYLRSTRAYWYWIVIFTVAVTVLSVFAIPEGAYPLVYLRYLLGLVFVLLLPGYSFIRVLFPAKPVFTVVSKDMDSFLRLALGVGIDLALIPITGLVLSFTPFGLYEMSIVLTLLSLTVIFATLAVVREYNSQFREEHEEE